jgi:hypothetical protein
MIDMVSVIEELSGLTSRELGEMLKESENFVLQEKTEDGGTKQVCMYNICCHLSFFSLTYISLRRWTWKSLCPRFLFTFLLYVWNLKEVQI